MRGRIYHIDEVEDERGNTATDTFHEKNKVKNNSVKSQERKALCGYHIRGVVHTQK